MIKRLLTANVVVSVLIVLVHSVTSNSETCPRQCRCDAIRKTVYCMNKELIDLPLGIPTDTRRLLLQNNKLVNSAELDYILSTLTSLEKLELSNNTLTAFPKKMPTSLTWISMKENTIKFIGSNSLFGLKSLRTLYLDDNAITNQGLTNSAFEGAENLETISLQGNLLSHIPSGIPENIQHVHFSRNRINNVAKMTMNRLKNIISLDLSYNLLDSSSIENEALKPMNELRYLDLSNNFLSFVPPSLPENISQLILSKNRISSISASPSQQLRERSLVGLSSLRHIDLSFNSLKNIEPGSFSDLATLKTVILHDNPWQCDCYLRYLMNWLIETPALVTMESNTVCHTPTAIQGVPLGSLDEESLVCFPSNLPRVNLSSTSNTITVSWVIPDGTYPPYAEFHALSGELICENCSQQEIIADVSMGEHSYVTSIVHSYDIFPQDFTDVKQGRASIEIPNLKPNKLYVICLLNSYDKVSERKIEDCEFMRTKELPSTTVAPKYQEDNIFIPVWLIIIIAVFVILVLVGVTVLLACWKSVSKKQQWKRRCRTETSLMTYDPFRQVYTMPDSRKELVFDAPLVGGVNISNYREGNLSATKDAGNEFDVTLVIKSNSNPNLLAIQASPETCDSYCSDSHDGTLSTSHTRTNTTLGSIHSHNGNNNVMPRQSTHFIENYSNPNDLHTLT